MRIAVGGVVHETSQYVSRRTVLDDFEVTTGPAIVERHRGRTYVGGMAAGIDEIGAELVGTFHALASSSGPIAAETHAQLKAGLLAGLHAAMPFDAVLLDLHGAAVADGCEDLEGDICAAVRELVGSEVVLVVTHDLHGNITQAEADAVDAMFGVHHYPHDDMYERGREAALCVREVLAGRWRPTTHVERLPMMIPPTSTYSGVGSEVLAICREAETRAGVIDVTFMHGFPYTDNPHVGCQVVVVADADRELASAVARDVAAKVWALRDRFLSSGLAPDDAIAAAIGMPGQPVVVNECSDNPGGGAPCDGTHLLRALLKRAPERAVFVGIKDAEVVQQATRAGVGATIDIQLGGKTDELHGAPIRCRAYVRSLTDGEIVLESPMGAGTPFALGPTARLVINGVDVIVISLPEQTYDRTPLLLHGIDPMQCKLVCLKSSNHFRSGFTTFAQGIVTADPPGLTTMRLDQLPRSRSPRPIFPLDADASY